MIEQGFQFPQNVATIDSGQKMKFEDIEKPDLSFLGDGDDGLPAPLELSFAYEHAAQKAAMPSPPTPDALSPGSQLSPNGVKSPITPESKPSVVELVKEEIKSENSPAATNQVPEVKSEEVKTEDIKTEEVKQDEEVKQENLMQ